MIIEGVLNIKTRDKYDNIPVRVIRENGQYDSFYILSYNFLHNSYSYVPLDTIENRGTVKSYTENKGFVYRITFINSLDVKRIVTCTDDTYFYTKNKKYINVKYLNKSHLCVDDEDRICKVINVQTTCDPSAMVYDIKLRYANAYFCNGILIR